ncbi:hypothetical protein RHSIM_Rhsim11G0026000 [Rhododendron simsii]|uniref:Cadmium-induced protein AS8 n=1 Tax=Rhododendron simsii TaxID=118357 RepID=A0A834G8B7_RHOSS|nr:hypothetical protein RHSIM_Rhsim11G0026000 [Rhododendron simsii]
MGLVGDERDEERKGSALGIEQVKMIIKGLFRRYERWNPVHPTSGAFWGMGIGFGCGVGWGPGFGPEVIGYVGAGCGFGFSVGITLAGFGIGLPANYVLEVPYSVFSRKLISLSLSLSLSLSPAVMATRSSALEIARSSGLLNLRNGSASGWSNIGPHISGIQQKALGRFSISKLGDSFNLSEMPRVAIDLARILSKKIHRDINFAHNKTKDSELKFQYNSSAKNYNDAIRDLDQSKKLFKNNCANKQIEIQVNNSVKEVRDCKISSMTQKVRTHLVSRGELRNLNFFAM